MLRTVKKQLAHLNENGLPFKYSLRITKEVVSPKVFLIKGNDAPANKYDNSNDDDDNSVQLVVNLHTPNNDATKMVNVDEGAKDDEKNADYTLEVVELKEYEHDALLFVEITITKENCPSLHYDYVNELCIIFPPSYPFKPPYVSLTEDEEMVHHMFHKGTIVFYFSYYAGMEISETIINSCLFITEALNDPRNKEIVDRWNVYAAKKTNAISISKEPPDPLQS